MTLSSIRLKIDLARSICIPAISLIMGFIYDHPLARMEMNLTIEVILTSPAK